MEIVELRIKSKQLDQQEHFYSQVLGFDCQRLSQDLLLINTKENRLYLEYSEAPFYYHFAFLIPTNSLDAAIEFMEQKSIKLLPFQGDNIIHFDSGRAIYFFDEDQNIVEFIERPLLDYPTSKTFSINDVIKVNEIGLPVAQPIAFSQQLIDSFGILPLEQAPWKENFCWVGDHNGVLIVVEEGRHWLPTKIPAVINDFSIKYQDQGKAFHLKFENNQITKF